MFCEKCGQKIDDNEKFCPNCGAPAAGKSQVPNSSVQTGNMGNGTGGVTVSKKPPYLAIGFVAIVAIAFIFIVRALFFSSRYEKPLKDLVKAMEKQDAGLVLSLMPDEVISYLEDDMDMSRAQLQQSLASSIDVMSGGGKIKMKYKIVQTTDLEKEDLEDFEEELDYTIKVKKGKSLKVQLETYVDGELKDSEVTTINVIKVGGKWYLDLFIL